MNYSFLVLCIFAYCLGSISSAVLICKIFNKPDPRTNGSKNPGATNVLRIAGKPYAAMVLLFDILKGTIPVVVAMSLGLAHSLLTWVALVAVLGHIFPVFMRFQGGKGVATALGALIALSPSVTGIALLVFTIILALTRMVSLSSILAAISAPIAYYYLYGMQFNLGLIILAVLITAKHHSNIKRILAGNENRI